MKSTMGPVWLLLLALCSVLRAQLTPTPPSVFTQEMDNSTDSGTNTSEASDISTTSTVSRPTKPPPTPSEAPTEKVEDWSPAQTFLYSGDSSALKTASCTRAYSPPGQTGPLPYSFDIPLRPALDALAHTANFLNMIFQASDLRESTVQEDMEWYHALVRALLDADVLIQQAMLTFDADPTAQAPQLVLRAIRNPATKVQTIVLQDMSKAWESLHPPAPSPDDRWFRRFKFPESNQPMAALSKRVLLNDLSTLDTPKWRQGDSYVTNRSGVRWANAPFLDCQDGRFVPRWMLTLSTSYYGLKPDLTPEFRGVIRVDVNIQDIDVDQCATGNNWFADTHQCNRTSMECLAIRGRGFQLGQYCCHCKEGYYNPDIPSEDLDGGPVNGSDGDAVCYPNMPICLPCWPGCKSCQDGTPCWVQEDWLLRAGVLAVQGVFMLLIFVSMLVAYRHRRNRRIRASGLLLLETILFGSLLLYFPVFILYFRPSTFRCILLRWVRMLGFSIVYGTVTLKMYRVLKVFLSRTAQRVPYMSSLRLMRILGVMLMTVFWFLCAWTVGVLQNRDRNIPVFVTTTTSDGQGFNLCYLDRWDYMMAVAELLFLCWGSSLWTAVRPVPSAFHEPRYMGIAIHNELLLSSMFHLLRFTFPSLHPDWMLLLSFTHTHVTITVTLALLFIPKFIYVSKPGRAEIAAEVYEDEVDLRRSCSYLNSSFHSAWSEHNVDPDDFREELKKLYAQLEVHKTKKMAANNPHLQKKRSSACAIGRSIIRRIAEIPESMSRQYSREERDGSFHSRSNQSDSFRRTPDTVSISYRSSIRTPSPSLRKSQSDHHYVRERDSSLRDSTLRTDTVKRCSQRSETDSLDIPPGVCKSASAQNLTIDTNLLHPDHTKLHKSWSLTSTTTHSMENIPKVNRSSTVLAKSRDSISIGEQTRSALLSESFDKAEICPWDVEQEPSTDKSHKHVTYANSEGSVQNDPKSPQTLICPWDFAPPVEKKPSEDKSESESPKPGASVSASAPGSPRPKVTKDQRVLSLRTSTNRWLSVKSFMGSIDGSSKTSLNREDSVSQKSQESVSTTPRSGTSSRRPSMEKRSLQKRSLTAVDGKPCLVKQNAVRLSSGDSSDRSPRRLVVVRSVVYPSDVDDMQKDGTYENVFLSRQNSKRSSVSSWETVSSSRTPSTHRKGSNRITPARNVSHSDVCPWDLTSTSQQGEGLKQQQSIKADVCPWESQVSERSNVCPWDSHEQGNVKRQVSGRGDVCPWESHDIPIISYRTPSKDSLRQDSLKHSTDVCPWESAESPQPLIRQDNEYANVCPWDTQNKAEVVYENLNPLNTKGSLTVPFQQEVMKAAVYPGAPRESFGVQQHYQAKLSAFHAGSQVSKTSESCPWDFPEPPKVLETICPWEEGNTETSTTKTNTNTNLTSQMTVKADICPWESEHQDKPEASKKSGPVLEATSVQTESKDRVNICPWETEHPEKPAAAKMISLGQDKVADVCPWDTEGPNSGKTEPTKILQSQDAARASVCPWETGGTETIKTEVPETSGNLQRQGNLPENVCPWETEEPKVVKTQDSGRTNVCPWETEQPKVLPKQDSSRTDVCPWETEQPKVLTKQDSSQTDVCPWETEQPKVLQKQDSTRADVCPWETEQPKVLQKQDSARADVCPWETEQPKVLQKQDSARADVCPWETEQPKVLQKQDSARADVCPWETEQPKVLQKQDSARADVCPWETEQPKVLQKQDSTRTDVCPWETEGPDVVKKQDDTGTEICSIPKTESKTDIPNSVNEDSLQNLGPPSIEETPPGISTAELDDSKTNLALGRRDALCPWEMVRTSSGSFTDNTSDVFTWEPENIPEEDEEDDAECAAEALVFPPDL
ncbi:probable G-protein coupled receptor 158 isoform X2 [Sphaeramia orbicularis]|uniref:probable G-protein coupled receptor 158 isoform X2 n=1 Tax=Sphaeramia orbicularis TaxID=375764 RepID=UPI00117C0844|nr:probable G-protein coupled receptor 158 isoform X2 [Sphaeramia orbicularis]